MTVTAFDPKDRLIYIEVVLEGPGGFDTPVFALDTGASRTTVAEAVLPRLGIDPTALPRRHRANTASSRESAGEVGLVRMTALGRTVLRPTVMFQALNPRLRVEGVLGLDFFRGRVVTIDFHRGRIRFTPPPAWWQFWR